MGVESVSVAEAFSHADTLEISYHSSTSLLLPALESMESKRHTSYRSCSTNVSIQNHWSTALKLLGKTARTKIILSPETPWTLYNYIYLKVKAAYGAKYWWYNGTQNENQNTSKTWNTVCYSVSNKQKPSTIPSRKCLNLTVFRPRSYNSLPKYLRDIESVRTKKFKFGLDKFLELIPDELKVPTQLHISPHQEATASSTSSLIWWLKELTKVVESPTRPRSSLSCFENTPSK